MRRNQGDDEHAKTQRELDLKIWSPRFSPRRPLPKISGGFGKRIVASQSWKHRASNALRASDDLSKMFGSKFVDQLREVHADIST